MRVAVVEVDDETRRHEVLPEVIEEGSAAGVVVERPAEAVLDEASAVSRWRDLPQLLDADPVLLRLATIREMKLADQLLGERAACPFGHEDVFRLKLHPALEARFRHAIAPG